MRLVEKGEALADASAAGEAIVTDHVAREARGASEPHGLAAARFAEHRGAIGRLDHVGHVAGGRDVGNPDRHAIVEQVEDFADEYPGVERDRFAGLDHNLAARRDAHHLQEGDKVVDLVVGARHMMAAAEVDPFELAEEGAQHRLDRGPCAGERGEILFAKAVHMDAVDALQMFRKQLGDRKAEAAARRGGIIFGNLAFAVHWVDAEADVEGFARAAKLVEQRTEALELSGGIEDQMVRKTRNLRQILGLVAREIGRDLLVAFGAAIFLAPQPRLEKPRRANTVERARHR